MKKLLLIRHGSTSIKTKDQVPDDVLSDEGRAQIKGLAERLSTVNFGKIISSDYLRATQSAEIISEYHYKDIVVEQNELYRELGLWVSPARLKADTEGHIREHKQIVRERVGDILQHVTGQFEHTDVLTVVAHGNLIRAIIGRATEMTFDTIVRLQVDHASLSILYYDEKAKFYRIVLFNDVQHYKKGI